jgi:hypothetical protein
MGSLKPGATYVYEHADGITYAREFGAPHHERFEIGRTFEKQSLDEQLREDKLWGNIRRAAKSNKLLQDALDRAIMIYHLSKKNGKE